MLAAIIAVIIVTITIIVQVNNSLNFGETQATSSRDLS
jgi:hypothetical protein